MKYATCAVMVLLCGVITACAAQPSPKQAGAHHAATPHPTTKPSPQGLPIGAVYSTDPGPGINDDQWGPQLDATLGGYCTFMRAQKGSTSFWTFSQSRSVEPGYDEIHWGAKVKILKGPFHVPCTDQTKDDFYWVRVVDGTTRGGVKEAYIQELWIQEQ